MLTGVAHAERTDEHHAVRGTTAPWARPPALLIALALVVTAVGIGMTVVGSQRIGVSTDEPGHVRRVNNYLAYGLYTRPFEVRQTEAGEIPTGAYIYGPVTAMLQHKANEALGNEPGYEARTRAHHYAVRHAVVGAMAILGLCAAAALGWMLLRDWRWGVLTAGILAATPLWTGHSMFNPKDVPVASGHTLITAGLVLLALAKPSTRLWAVSAAALPLVGGIVLMLGTRPELWPTLVASLAVFGIVMLRARTEHTRAHRARVVATLAAALVASYGMLNLVYPRVFGDLVEWLRVTIAAGTHYDGLGDHAPSGRTYLPLHLLTDLPLGLLALMAAGTVFVVVAACGRRRSVEVDSLALVASQAFALMGAAIVLNSNMYQGLRQVLFALPALAVLAAVGLAFLLARVQGGAWRWRLAAVAGIALVLPTAAQASLFPYQYSYVNAVADRAGLVGHDGPDYFATSFREYALTGPQDVKVVCPFLRFGGVVKRDDADCRTRFAHTFSAYWRGRPTPDRPEGDEYYAVLRGSRPTPPNCAVHQQVERRVHGKQVVMSRLFRCHPPTPAEKRAGDELKRLERAEQGWEPGPGGRGWVPATD